MARRLINRAHHHAIHKFSLLATAVTPEERGPLTVSLQALQHAHEGLGGALHHPTVAMPQQVHQHVCRVQHLLLQVRRDTPDRRHQASSAQGDDQQPCMHKCQPVSAPTDLQAVATARTATLWMLMEKKSRKQRMALMPPDDKIDWAPTHSGKQVTT